MSKEWNGYGMPPVGAECQMLNSTANWTRVKILGIVDGHAIGFSLAEKRAYSSNLIRDFYPLKTESQLDREELEELVFQASGIRSRDGGKASASDVAEALIKAGYSKGNNHG